jgi:DNA-binding NarL/FixJ family response regulator
VTTQPAGASSSTVERDHRRVAAAAELVERARAALKVGDAAGARAAVASLDEDGDVLDVLARADYLELNFTETIAYWERAYAAYRAVDDRVGAIRTARMVAAMYFQYVGDFAVCGGWLARAKTLLEDAGPTSERGWVSLNIGMFEPDRERKNELLQKALSDARVSGDAGLEVAALAYLGASLVHADQHDEGMRLLDEAMAAVAGDEVDDFFIVEELFCQLFSACEYAQDVARADQWMRIGEVIAERRNLPAVSAYCRTHYGGVMTSAGRWAEADAALSDAVRLWALGQRSSILRGGALVRLAELRVRQGRYEEAEALLADLDPLAGEEGARPRAAIHLAKGETALAREALERALESIGPASVEAAPLLELLVEVLVAQDDFTAAQASVDQLHATALRTRNEYVRALAALARGRLCLASSTGDPRTCLREALNGFTRARVPLESARARLALAHAFATDNPDVALAEARAALDAFEQLEAARHADAAAALLRSLGVRPSTARSTEVGNLTKREAEVLDLLGHGLSNPEIADRLFISRKTVEHHVSNVLAKLGLRTRGEAAAYAVRHPARTPEPGAK